jgi:PST family polysaccharide transporter
LPRSSVADVSTKKALAFVYVGYAFRYLYLLILVPFYGRVLGAAEYGRVLAAMALFQLVWMLAEFGFPSVGMRDVAIDRSPGHVAAIYGRHTSARLLMSPIGIVVGTVGTLASPVLRERPIFGVLATLSGLVAAFNLGWFFQGTLRFRTSVLLEFLSFTLSLLLILPLVRGSGDGWLVLASLLASSVIATTIAHTVAIRSLDRARLRWGGATSLVRESTALFAARGLALMTSSSSTYLISVFAEAREVGWYGAAERLASACISLMQPANQVLIGTVAALIASKDTERRAFALIRRGLAALLGFGTLALLGTLALAGVFVPLVLGPQFGPSVSMLRILAFMFPLAAIVQVVEGYVLVPLRYDRSVTGTSFVGAMVTVVLTVALGKLWGGHGVAFARLLGYASMCAALTYVLRREGLFARLFAPDWRAQLAPPGADPGSASVAVEPRRKVFVNGRFLTQRVTGVQRYAREVLAALDAVAADDPSLGLDLEVLAPPGVEPPPLRAIRFRNVGPLSGNLWEQIVLPWAARGALLHSFSATGPLLKRRQTVTIHDASVYTVPFAFSWTFRTWYRFLLRVLATRSPCVLTVSRFSRSEVARYFGCDESKIRVSVEGWQHIRRFEADAGILERHGLRPRRYVLAVSSPTPNKNFRLIARAIESIEAPDFDVVLVGSVDGKVFARGEVPRASFVKCVGYVSDAELRALYESAGVFVYPSLYEGFGIPAIEAMACGCPVIASRASALPEVCGDAALYVSPYDAQELASAIVRLMESEDARRALVDKGRARIEAYSWTLAARAQVACMDECLRASDVDGALVKAADLHGG